MDYAADMVSRRDRQGGFVLLAVVVIAAIAFLAVGTAAVLAREVSLGTGMDVDSASADAAVRAGLTAAAAEIRWSGAYAGSAPLTFSGSCDDRSRYDVTIDPDTFNLSVDGSCGATRRVLAARLTTQPTAIAAGCAVSGDCVLDAPTVIAGAGLYVGHDVSGREQVSFLGGGGVGPACDLVHPELWSLAGVHAGGDIFLGDGEEPASSDEYETDSCVHSGTPPPPGITSLPDAIILADLRMHAIDAEVALQDNVLHLDELPAAPIAQAGKPSDGIVVVVSPDVVGGRISIRGRRAPGACPATVVIDGDAQVDGDDQAGAALSGALIIMGQLSVEAPLCVQGCLLAGGLRVFAPLNVTIPASWPRWCPDGFLKCVLTAMD